MLRLARATFDSRTRARHVETESKGQRPPRAENIFLGAIGVLGHLHPHTPTHPLGRVSSPDAATTPRVPLRALDRRPSRQASCRELSPQDFACPSHKPPRIRQRPSPYRPRAEPLMARELPAPLQLVRDTLHNTKRRLMTLIFHIKRSGPSDDGPDRPLLARI